jgi:hypothetical protein
VTRRSRRLWPTHHFGDRSLQLLELRVRGAFGKRDNDRLLVRSSHGQRHQHGDEEGDKEELHVGDASQVWFVEEVRQVKMSAGGDGSDLLQSDTLEIRGIRKGF